tara:strand:- start:384 stop:518 length:135 start_codon:yes stop_codon:yes gene_type:complete
LTIYGFVLDKPTISILDILDLDSSIPKVCEVKNKKRPDKTDLLI